VLHTRKSGGKDRVVTRGREVPHPTDLSPPLISRLYHKK
jgi:hypothetical protein